MYEMIWEYLKSFPVLWTPLIALLLYVVFLVCRLRAQRRSRKDPGAVKAETIDKLRTCTRVFGSIAIITWVLIGGGMLLLYEAVEHM